MVFQAPNCPLPPPDITVQDAQFIYSVNFEGRPETYNEEGNRYFNLLIPDNILEQVQADNWNISWTKPKDPDEQPRAFLKVHVGFKYRPPFVSVWEDGKETILGVEPNPNGPDHDTVKVVDKLTFDKVDVVVRGRAWENKRGECGIKAWLKTFVGVVESDDIRRKYAAMRETADEN